MVYTNGGIRNLLNTTRAFTKPKIAVIYDVKAASVRDPGVALALNVNTEWAASRPVNWPQTDQILSHSRSARRKQSIAGHHHKPGKAHL